MKRRRKPGDGSTQMTPLYDPYSQPQGLDQFTVEDTRYSLRVDRSVTREEVEALLRVERSA